MRQIVVIAGGLATRLYPITKTVPKSMIPVGGEPFFSHQLRLFKRNGIEEVVMCVGYLAEQIMDFYGDGAQFGVKIVYSKEDKKRDTGGAIKLALPLLDEHFFIIYGDSYLLQNFQSVATYFSEHPALGLMCVYENNNHIEPSRVLLEGGCVKLYRKEPPPEGAQHMEYGLNIFSRSIITQVAEEVFPISAYFDLLTPQHQLLAFPVKERFYEIGSFNGIDETNQLLSKITQAEG